MKFKEMKLSDVCDVCGKSIKPLENEQYVLYSLPAYDNGRTPEYVYGTSIKSNKIEFPESAILYNKLNVKNKRVWNVVNKNNNKICSTEYIPLVVKYNYDKDYVYYYVITEDFTNLMDAASKGTSTSHQRIDANVLLNCKIMVPEYETQQKISKILREIDDKIEINNKINKNLEEQILSYWQELFINSNNKSSNWSVLELSKVTTNIRNKVENNNYPVLSAINTGELQFSEEFFNKRVFSKDISKYIIVNNNDFAYNPARINIGSIGINDLGVIGCVSPVYVVFRVEKGYHNFFNIYIKSNSFKEEVKTRASGSVRQTLTYEDLGKIQIKYPSKEVINKFNNFCDPLFLSIKTIKLEINKLVEIRDTLLPKLMSGEIDVSKIDI